MARVLVVDDEENIRVAFTAFLEQSGHEVTSAGDVESADRSLETGRFDVVVTDVIMQGRKGTDLMRTLRERGGGEQVIIITGEPTVDSAVEAVRAGATDYLTKPVRGAVLQRVVNHAARIKHLQDERRRLAEENARYQLDLERRVEQRTQDLVKALDGIVTAMSVTVEKRDPYTAGHQVRVARLAEAIARQLRLEEATVRGAYLSGMIHDIGKISVPAEFLVKPARLDADEMSILRRHPQTGFDILKNIEFFWPIAEIVYQHHERLDGSGYPRGLTGDRTFPEARILVVADVVEAMASHRPYRPQLGIDAALAEVEGGRGTAFDPDVVDACASLFRVHRYRL